MNTHRLISIKIENFKSFKDIFFEFGDQPGLNFLTGRNEIEPRLGANGAGKSSLWDALFWCLYGVSILGDRASELVSWGAKRPFVETLWDVRGEPVTIGRMGSPEKITISLQPAAQSDVDDIMDLSRVRFMQSVLFGQNMPMFWDLDIPARGKLLDEALDLSIWNAAADKASDKTKEKKQLISSVERDLSFAEGKLEGLPNIAELQSKCDTWDEQQETRLISMLDAAENFQKISQNKKSELETQRKLYAAMPYPDKARIDAYTSEIKTVTQQIGETIGAIRAGEKQCAIFHTDKVKCPQCLQTIDKQHKAANLKAEAEVRKTLTDTLAQYEKDKVKAADRLKTAIEEAEAIQKSRDTAKSLGEDLAHEWKMAERDLELAFKDFERIEKEINPYHEQITSTQIKHDKIIAEIKQIKLTIKAHEGEMLLYDFWKTGFKRVRLFIIKRILLQLEIEISNAASLLGIGDWRITLKTETETKSGDLKHGVQIGIVSPASSNSVALPSGGEGQRIRLAINMGLSSLIQRMAGVRYNLEVWDEPSNSLSDEGIDDLLDCLRYRAQQTRKTIWLTDHRTFSFNFDESWIAIKGKNGTVIEQLGTNANA